MIVGTFFMMIAVAVIGGVLSNDSKTAIPRFARYLLVRSARRINDDYSAGFLEEWLAHLDETPEVSLKLWHAVSIHLWGAARIGREIGYSDEAFRRYDKAKRAFDVVCSVFMVPTIVLLFIPMVPVLLISLARGNNPFRPVLKMGRGGRPFRTWKFRTLRRLGSHEMRVYHRASSDMRACVGGNYYVLTSFGAIVRRTSIDEIPMIWSVFRGDMSLVGPRRHPMSFSRGADAARFSSVRPGIVSPSNLYGSKSTNWSLDYRIDREYLERRSFQRDLRIIRDTMWLVFSKRRREVADAETHCCSSLTEHDAELLSDLRHEASRDHT